MGTSKRGPRRSNRDDQSSLVFGANPCKRTEAALRPADQGAHSDHLAPGDHYLAPSEPMPDHDDVPNLEVGALASVFHRG
jgi:hypothetical protein